MRFPPWVSIVALLVCSAPGHAESVYKLKDSSGATVYSDRPNLPGTTQEGTVDVPPGPSAEQQQAARQNVRQMESKSDELRQSRLERAQQGQQAQDRNTAADEIIESSGVGVVDGRRRRDPKTRIPLESPDGGEHPIYTPRNERPVPVVPRPRPSPGHR